MDWIKARLDCSIEQAWVILREQIRSDLERWKQFNPQKETVLVDSGESHIMASRKDVASTAWVRVARQGAMIAIHTPNPESSSHPINQKLYPRLNEKGECRLVLDGNEMEFWQVSRLALEPVLFL